MTTLPSHVSTHVDENSFDRRIGKSNYWVEATREEIGPASSWRLAVVQRPSRVSKSRPPQHLVRFSAQNPLFTFVYDGQRFPLMIDSAAHPRGGKITIGGSRKISAAHNAILTWVGDIETHEENGIAYIKVDGRFRCPGVRIKNTDIALRIPIVSYRPTVIDNPIPEAGNISAAAVWIEHAESAIGFVVTTSGGSEVSFVDSALQTKQHAVDLRGRVPVHFVLAFRHSISERDALQLIRTEAAETIAPLLPSHQGAESGVLEAAERGIAHLLDSKNCTPVGKERWYYRASRSFDYGPGYPFFSTESSPALLRWTKFHGSEIGARIAKLTARGVASDFAVIVGESGAEGNKGAFWDCAAGSPESLTFSTYDGSREYGIASNARIAYALLQMFEETQDYLFKQASLNACHWLILKQNAAAYYDGPYIGAKSGRFTELRNNLDGVLAIRPLVAAFRATGNDVFIKNAWKIANFLKSTLLPLGKAPCLFGKESDTNCPVALSGVVHCLLDLDAEAPNDDLRKTLMVIADWLALCRFDEGGHACLDYDQSQSGLLECASAALRLFTFTGQKKWFKLGYALTRKPVGDHVVNWRLADASIQLLLSLGKLIPGVSVDLAKMIVTHSWFKFVPDSAASLYYDVRDQNRNQVDFLPLVCRENHQTILLVLAKDDEADVHLIKRNLTSNTRIPVVDLVTNAPCTMDLPLHPLPDHLGYFAVVRVDP